MAPYDAIHVGAAAPEIPQPVSAEAIRRRAYLKIEQASNGIFKGSRIHK